MLGVLGTGLAFAIYYTLIAELGASRASVVAYVAPGFSIVYGAVGLDEPITVGVIAGLALILAGSWMTTHDKPAAPPAEPQPAAVNDPRSTSRLPPDVRTTTRTA